MTPPSLNKTHLNSNSPNSSHRNKALMFSSPHNNNPSCNPPSTNSNLRTWISSKFNPSRRNLSNLKLLKRPHPTRFCSIRIKLTRNPTGRSSKGREPRITTQTMSPTSLCLSWSSPFSKRLPKLSGGSWPGVISSTSWSSSLTSSWGRSRTNFLTVLFSVKS